jgi:hypothetical protein
MDKEKVVIVAEKVKSFAIAFIGIIFFSLGTSYFQERLLYRVPRILIPIFDTLGYIGLAIGLLILGGGFIVYGFVTWKKVAQKQSLYWIIAIVGLVIGSVLANTNFKSSEQLMNDIHKQHEAQIDEVRNSDKPKFKDSDVNKYLDEFDDIYKRFEQSLKDEDEDVSANCEKEFGEWVSKAANFIPKLNNDEKTDLARYVAKLSVSWNDLRTKTDTK